MPTPAVPRSCDALDRALGVRFRDAGLREAALTHRSFAFEQRAHGHERAARVPGRLRPRARRDRHGLPRRIPDLPEGQLAKLRAAIVNMQALADVARGLGIGELVLLGKGEEQSGGRDKSSILADALEAVFGAVYLDQGLEPRPRADRAALPPADGGLRPRRGRPRLQDDPAGARVAGAAGRCPSTGCEERGPDHQKDSPPPCPWRARSSGSGAGVPRRKPSSRRHARPTSACVSRGAGDDTPEEGTAVELPEVEVMRRDLEKDVVGKHIKSVEVKATKQRHARRSAGTDRARSSPSRLAGDKIAKVERARQVRPDAPRRRRRAGRALRDVAASFQRGNQAAWRSRRTPTSSSTFQQGGDLRFVDPRTFGEMFVDVGRRAGQGQGARTTSRSTRWTTCSRGSTFQYLLAETRREAEAAADGPEVHLRARQHLLRRGAVRAPGSASTGCQRHAVLPGGAAALPRDAGGRCRRRSASGAPRWRTRRTWTCSASRGSSRRAQGLRPRRACRAGGAAPRSQTVKITGRSTYYCPQCQS